MDNLQDVLPELTRRGSYGNECSTDKKEHIGTATNGHNTYTMHRLIPSAHYYVYICTTHIHIGSELAKRSKCSSRVFQVPNADGSFTRDPEDEAKVRIINDYNYNK